MVPSAAPLRRTRPSQSTSGGQGRYGAAHEPHGAQRERRLVLLHKQAWPGRASQPGGLVLTKCIQHHPTAIGYGRTLQQAPKENIAPSKHSGNRTAHFVKSSSTPPRSLSFRVSSRSCCAAVSSEADAVCADASEGMASGSSCAWGHLGTRWS